MTRKVFWEDPYRTRLQTTIASVDGPRVELESTIFFAFSGGQESDRGTIGGLPVALAQKEGGRILYTLPPDHGLRAGQAVEVAIDWERRYRLMKLHFAAELVLELCSAALQGVEKVGAHIAQEKARIDFAWPESVAPHLPRLSDRANQLIASDLPILTGFDDPGRERRYWCIEGFSRVPCGGTHVRSTGEIGPIRLKRVNLGRGKERVEIHLAS